MMKNRFLQVAMTGLVMVLLSCGCGTTMSRIRSKEPDVKEYLKSFNYGLKSEAWGSVERFFSQDYEGGYQNLAPHMENFWRNEDLVEIRFIVLEVVETDDQISSRVRWHKSYVDKAGILKNASGTSEIIFKEIDKRLKIFAIHGELFF
jgi:hypothetical protein